MLAGTPVLAANEGGPTETVVDGETGWLRDVKDIGEWTAIMRKVLGSELDVETLRQMGENGRRRVTELFSKEKMAQSFEQEIEGLADVERPRLADTNVLLAAAGLILAVIAYGLRVMLFDA